MRPKPGLGKATGGHNEPACQAPSILTALLPRMAVMRLGLTHLPDCVCWFFAVKTILAQLSTVLQKGNAYKERETRNCLYDSKCRVNRSGYHIKTATAADQNCWLLPVKKDSFFPMQGQTTGQPQCTLQLLPTAVPDLLWGFFFNFSFELQCVRVHIPNQTQSKPPK